MANNATDEDLLVAKVAAMEIMLLTLVRPIAGNPKYWQDVEAITAAFQRGNADLVDNFPERWNAINDFLAQWRQVLNPQG